MPEATGEVLVLIHSLSGVDLQWHAQHKGYGVDHGWSTGVAQIQRTCTRPPLHDSLDDPAHRCDRFV